MKKIAIVTGASGGLGEAFVKQMMTQDIDEIWCIARTQSKLENLKSKYGERIVPLPLDLCEGTSLQYIQKCLKEQAVSVVFLINNAGIGETLDSYQGFGLEQITQLITVNCTAVVSLCALAIPYMHSGSKIINIASQSAFQPVPYLNLYASSKVFVRHYTRALNVELKQKHITATGVCPGWVDTDMLVREINGKQVYYPGIVCAERVAQKAMRDAKKGKDMSVCTLYVKYMHLLAKILPQKMVMWGWMRAIKRYIK